MVGKTKGFRIALIILGLAGAAGAAYLVGRNLTQSNNGGQTIPPVSGSGSENGGSD
jgi:hypothetical protein